MAPIIYQLKLKELDVEETLWMRLRDWATNAVSPFCGVLSGDAPAERHKPDKGSTLGTSLHKAATLRAMAKHVRLALMSFSAQLC